MNQIKIAEFFLKLKKGGVNDSSFFEHKVFIKFFLFEFVGFFETDLGNIILDITSYEFLPLKFSVFERRPDKVS